MTVLVSAITRHPQAQAPAPAGQHARTPLTQHSHHDLPPSLTRLLAANDTQQPPIVSAFQSSV